MGVLSAPGRAANAAPGEKIVSFHADVAVRKDATLDVREEFVLHSEATYFRWGMIRELPIDAEARWDTRYAGEWKQDTGLRVKILEVSEDCAPASYRQGSGWGYAQLEIGPRNVPVAAGDHRYVVRYTVEHALGPKADHDELYWNALGHYWQLPVSETSVAIHLPPGVTMSDVRAEAWLGGRGVSFPRRPESELAREDDDSGAVVYRATRLGPAQALSVVARGRRDLSMPRGGACWGINGGCSARRRWSVSTISWCGCVSDATRNTGASCRGMSRPTDCRRRRCAMCGRRAATGGRWQGCWRCSRREDASRSSRSRASTA